MSEESATAFLERIKKDEELARRLGECEKDEEKIKLAKMEGYDFTVPEFKKALKGLSKNEYDQLTAGGFHTVDLRK